MSDDADELAFIDADPDVEIVTEDPVPEGARIRIADLTATVFSSEPAYVMHGWIGEPVCND